MHARRKLLVLAALSAAQGWSLIARAQQPAKVWRLGYLGVPSRGVYYEAFVQGMRDLGYVEGKNLFIESRFAEGNYERLPGLAVELVNLKVDAILASSTPAVSAAKRATASIPIVMGSSGDPLGAGFVKSLARPGGNITGTATPMTDFVPKQIELLRRVIRKLSRLGVLLNPGNAANWSILKSVETAAQKAGVKVFAAEARTPGEIASALQAQGQQRVEAVIVLPDGLLLQQRDQIAELAAKHRLPTMYQLREHVEAGGLMSYGQDLLHNHRLAATYVDRIFRGANPGDLPVEQSSRLELIINGKTAKALGLSIPKDILFLADKVIE